MLCITEPSRCVGKKECVFMYKIIRVSNRSYFWNEMIKNIQCHFSFFTRVTMLLFTHLLFDVEMQILLNIHDLICIILYNINNSRHR